MKSRAANIVAMSTAPNRSASSMFLRGAPDLREVEPHGCDHRPVQSADDELVEREATPPSVSIVGINYAPEITGIGVYSTGMARYLAAAGHRVVVHTGFPYYPKWGKVSCDRRTGFREHWDEGVLVRRNYLYVPSKPTVVRRIVHELSFVISATCSYLLGPRTDVTIIVSPPLFLGLPVALLAWMKGSKVLFHVQDLQPDAAVELGMMRRGLMTRVLFALERWTYRVADKVSAISPGMLRKIETKGVSPRKLLLFRNWADDTIVTPQARDTRFRESWDLGNKFVVLYAGNLGVKQGLISVLEAADLLRDRPEIEFVIVGDGGEKQKLEDYARAHSLGNVQFRPLQAISDLSELLATSDVSVVPQRRAVSDIVLPSKINNLLGSGRPIVVAADPGTDLHRVITEADCGVVVGPGDARALAQALVMLCDSPQTRARMGVNGRRLVDTTLSQDVVLGQFNAWLRSWTGAGQHATSSRQVRAQSILRTLNLATSADSPGAAVTSSDGKDRRDLPGELPA